jgi:hypothetical protein
MFVSIRRMKKVCIVIAHREEAGGLYVSPDGVTVAQSKLQGQGSGVTQEVHRQPRKGSYLPNDYLLNIFQTNSLGR